MQRINIGIEEIREEKEIGEDQSNKQPVENNEETLITSFDVNLILGQTDYFQKIEKILPSGEVHNEFKEVGSDKTSAMIPCVEVDESKGKFTIGSTPGKNKKPTKTQRSIFKPQEKDAMEIDCIIQPAMFEFKKPGQ